MKVNYLFSTALLGIGLAMALLLGLAHTHSPVHADPGIYYVQADGAGDCLSTTTPCGSIQTALALATLPGDQVWVAAGTYTENLALVHPIQLRGGWNISFTIQAPLTYPTIVDGQSNHIITAEIETGALLIQGFVLQNGRDGVHLYDGDITMTLNTIRNVTRQGIEIEDGDILLENNLFANIAREGIEIDGGAVTVRSNQVYTTGRHGIIVEGGVAIVEDNDVRNVVENPLDDYHGIEITGNHVVSGNRVSDVDDRGIYARGGSYTIANNTIYRTGGDGIRTDNLSTDANIRGNTVYSTGNDGIDARGAIVTLTDNQIHDTDDRGINAEDGALTIVGNQIWNTAGDGLRTSGSSTQVEIRDNVVQFVSNDGLDVRGDIITITHNEVSGCADNGIRSEGDDRARIEANRVLSSGVGIAIRGAQGFTLTNNIVANSVTASVELSGTATGALYHNTLVGGRAAPQAIGVRVVDPMTLTMANNILVSHTASIEAEGVISMPWTIHHTLLWGNEIDPLIGSDAVFNPPGFVDPARHDYHLRTGSPAIEAGADVGVTSDADGQPRPIGDHPDLGADEFPAGVSVTKEASPHLVQPGGLLTYTIRVVNSGLVTLTATITDLLPTHVSPTGTRAWTATLPAPGAVWTETVVVTAEQGYIGPLVNRVQVAAVEGAADIFTHTLAPALSVTKWVTPTQVGAGERLTYTLAVTNTGNFALHAIITDTLPRHILQALAPGKSVYLPGGQITWTAALSTPGSVWTATVVVTAAADYTGPLTNIVHVTTAEGITGTYTQVAAIIPSHAIYLPVVLSNYPPVISLQNAGFETGRWTHDTHDGKEYDNIFTPESWVTWWLHEEEYGQPEVKIIPNQPPFIHPLPRIHTGQYATLLFTFYRLQDMGLYQVVNGFPPGVTVQFSAYAHGWSCDQDYPLGYTCGDPWNQRFQVGIEPDGAADPFSSNIIWSPEQSAPDHYALIGPVTAQVGTDGRVCVYLRSQTRWAVKHQDAYWDDASLVTQG